MRADTTRGSLPAAILLTVVMTVIQAGCLSGPAPPDRFYRLEVPDAAAPLAIPRLRGRLLVDSVRGDGMTRERQMLYRSASDPSQVKREGYDNWVDAPPVMVQRAVVEFLRSANAAEVVITPEMRLDADFRLGGRVHRFERLVGQGSSRVTIETPLRSTSIPPAMLLSWTACPGATPPAQHNPNTASTMSPAPVMS